MLTTKSVWPMGGRQPAVQGSTCAEPNYLKWVLDLQKRGFEIGYHNATFHTSPREETRAGLEKFKSLFGHAPRSASNHFVCRENMYWGDSRLTGGDRLVYNLLTRFRQHNQFRGHWEGDACFWGDLCQANIGYLRNFVFGGINTLEACPSMPYHDPARPFVPFWFASSEGANATSFVKCIHDRNQDHLESEGGACIMYTHFAHGFLEDEKLNSQFKIRMERLAARAGWFVPVHTLLDFLKTQHASSCISSQERTRMERKWLLHKMTVGAT
jgi:hypothetical protein